MAVIDLKWRIAWATAQAQAQIQVKEELEAEFEKEKEKEQEGQAKIDEIIARDPQVIGGLKSGEVRQQMKVDQMFGDGMLEQPEVQTLLLGLKKFNPELHDYILENPKQIGYVMETLQKMQSGNLNFGSIGSKIGAPQINKNGSGRYGNR